MLNLATGGDARPAARPRGRRSPGSGSTGGCGTAADVARPGPGAGARRADRARPTPRFDDVLAAVRGRAAGPSTGCATRCWPACGPDDQVVVVTGASRGVGVHAGRRQPGRRAGPYRQRRRAGRRPPAGQRGGRRAAGPDASASPRRPACPTCSPAGSALAEAIQRAPRIPSLRVITTGGTATAAGLMQSQRAARRARRCCAGTPGTW